MKHNPTPRPPSLKGKGERFFSAFGRIAPLPVSGMGAGEGAKKSNYRFGICKNTLPQGACPKCGRVWPGLRIS
ncbi:MAG: hypothetical protein DRP97_06450 [Candidatus Latescibacterota bacterium]|nr:MAG: hypothetical protein DRP97_06450 [Candidatus Latescibacterota bacterium]